MEETSFVIRKEKIEPSGLPSEQYEEADSDEEHTPLQLRRTVIKKKKEIQKLTQYTSERLEQQLTQEDECQLSTIERKEKESEQQKLASLEQKGSKSQTRKKLPLRKSTRGSVQEKLALPTMKKPVTIEEQHETSAKEQGSEVEQIPKKEVKEKAVVKGKRRTEVVQSATTLASQEKSQSGTQERKKKKAAIDQEAKASKQGQPRKVEATTDKPRSTKRRVSKLEEVISGKPSDEEGTVTKFPTTQEKVDVRSRAIGYKSQSTDKVTKKEK